MNTFELARSVSELRARGFTSFDCENMMSAVRIAINGLNHILDDPDARRLFTIPEVQYPRDELGEPYEMGILPKKSGEEKLPDEMGFFDRAAGRTDDDPLKDRFHYTPKLLHLLHSTDRGRHAEFFAAVESFNRQALALVSELAGEFDRKKAAHPGVWGYPGTLLGRMRNAVAITRLLRYEKAYAKVHRDRDGFSVHHYSSHPGLYLFDKKKVAHTIDETNPRSLAVFTGEKFWAVTRGRFGTGVPHGVSSLGKSSVASRIIPRYAIVTFIHINLSAADVGWLHEHLNQIEIDAALFKM